MADLFYRITEDHFREIAEQIDDSEGKINLEIEDGEYLICFKGYYFVRGEYEGGYYSGTGAYYYTDANVYLSCEVFDGEGDIIPNNFECGDFERYLLEL